MTVPEAHEGVSCVHCQNRPHCVAVDVMRNRPRATPATLVALLMAATGLFLLGAGGASAAIVPTVPLATSANYAVLGASTVTNTGNSVLDGSLGLWPGTSITGFPPGVVLPPGTTDTTNAAAQHAQSDLTTAYVNAAGRPVNATTTADLANLHLSPGVYSGPSKSALGLSGPLVLDGGGDLSSVFIFQTNSTLVTGSSSTVSLINGAQECNVFWQVGSSATLGTSSVFSGNILALTSITVTNSVTVHGRTLARNGAVTLDDDTFTQPTCARPTPGATSTTSPGATATTTVVPGGVQPGTTPTTPAGPTGASVPGSTATGVPATGVPGGLTTTGVTTTAVPAVVITSSGVPSPALPRTGFPISATVLLAAIALALGGAIRCFARRQPRA